MIVFGLVGGLFIVGDVGLAGPHAVHVPGCILEDDIAAAAAAHADNGIVLAFVLSVQARKNLLIAEKPSVRMTSLGQSQTKPQR